MLKLMRAYFGQYTAASEILMTYKPVVMKLPRPIITIISSNQGYGQIKGTTTEKENNSTVVFPNAQICLFKKNTRELLWETKSKASGSYYFRNIAVGLECFIVAFDPAREYNAVIQDAVVAK